VLVERRLVHARRRRNARVRRMERNSLR
jgi:hypothetical protein